MTLRTLVQISNRLMILLFAVVAPVAAFADCAGDYCSQVYVDQIYVESGLWGDNIWVQTTGTETGLTCVPNSSIFLRVTSSMSQRKDLLAVLLTAYSMDKKVTIRIATGSQDCLIAYVLLDRQ